LSSDLCISRISIDSQTTKKEKDQMKKTITTILLFVLAFAMYGCGGHNKPTASVDESSIVASSSSIETSSATTQSSSSVVLPRKSAIQLVTMNGLAKVGVSPDSCPETVDICLGDLFKSRAYYFIIQNAGDSAITDLKITSSHDNWSVVPGAMPRLDLPGKSSVVPLLTVGIGHGTELFSTAAEPLLWDGLVGNGSVVDTLTFKWTGGEQKYTIGVIARVVRLAWSDTTLTKIKILGNCDLESKTPSATGVTEYFSPGDIYNARLSDTTDWLFFTSAGRIPFPVFNTDGCQGAGVLSGQITVINFQTAITDYSVGNRVPTNL
jgi:hypothetical protein